MKDDDDDEEEEKRITASGGGGDGGGISTVVVPHELLVFEVLTRLPAKPLMRFKCVSNLWRSTISQDTSFSKTHRARSSSSASLFVTYPDADDSIRCFYANLPSTPGESILLHQFTPPVSSSSSLSDPSKSCTRKYNGATEVINGLFCLHAGNRAWICNVSTREIRELPWSIDLDIATCFNYFLGFDSTLREYKLLKLCSFPYMHNQVVISRTLGCEILTLGKDASWRRPWTLLNAPEIGIALNRRNVYIDGSLCCWHSSGYSFTVFNFKDESFQVIDPPPKSSGSRYDECGSLLLQFRGHFALLREEETLGRALPGFVNRKLAIWVLEMDKFKRGSYEWTNHLIDVPCDFPLRGRSFLGNLPLPTGDQMLLTGRVEIINKSDVLGYSYDYTKGTFEKFVVGKVPPWSPLSRDSSARLKDLNKFRIYYYEEDITPLNGLTISNKDSSPTATSCINKDSSLTAACCTKKKKKKKKKKKQKKKDHPE